MKKIRIIEVGRVLGPEELTTEELKKINGGTCPGSYTGCNSYNNCGWTSYESCSKTSAYGYESDGSGNTTCSTGYTYSSCGLGSNNYTICKGPYTS